MLLDRVSPLFPCLLHEYLLALLDEHCIELNISPDLENQLLLRYLTYQFDILKIHLSLLP